MNSSTLSQFWITIVIYIACKTVKGEKCIFPFKAHGRNHTRCFQINGEGEHKCATEVKPGETVPDEKLGVCNVFCDNEGKKKMIRVDYRNLTN